MDNQEENNAFWYGVAIGIFPVAPLLMFVFLPTVGEGDTSVDTIWKLLLALLGAFVVAAITGFVALIVGFAIGGLMSIPINNRRGINNKIDVEHIAGAIAFAVGTGDAIALLATVIKSFVLNY